MISTKSTVPMLSFAHPSIVCTLQELDPQYRFDSFRKRSLSNIVQERRYYEVNCNSCLHERCPISNVGVKTKRLRSGGNGTKEYMIQANYTSDDPPETRRWKGLVQILESKVCGNSSQPTQCSKQENQCSPPCDDEPSVCETREIMRKKLEPKRSCQKHSKKREKAPKCIKIPKIMVNSREIWDSPSSSYTDADALEQAYEQDEAIGQSSEMGSSSRRHERRSSRNIEREHDELPPSIPQFQLNDYTRSKERSEILNQSREYAANPSLLTRRRERLLARNRERQPEQQLPPIPQLWVTNPNELPPLLYTLDAEYQPQQDFYDEEAEQAQLDMELLGCSPSQLQRINAMPTPTFSAIDTSGIPYNTPELLARYERLRQIQ